MITQYGHGTGGILSPVDDRDLIWNKHLGMSAIPFNWDMGYNIEDKLPTTLSLKNQGQSYSCGGQSGSYYGEVLESISTGTEEERSAKFLYAQVFKGNGGAYLRDICDIAVKQGWAREAVLSSYLNGIPPTEQFMEQVGDITDTVRTDASLSKALSYTTVDHTNIDTVAQAIANNYGAILLIEGENNGTWLSTMPEVTKSTDTWNHFLYAGKAKLINGKKYLGVKNSWGNVGDNGWQWISEDFFTSGHILEVRTLVYKDAPKQYVFNNNLCYGMKNGDVLQLQARLGVDQTGYFGWKTFLAVISYQRAHNILSTGFVGSITRLQLNMVQ